MGKTIAQKIFESHLVDTPFDGTYVLKLVERNRKVYDGYYGKFAMAMQRIFGGTANVTDQIKIETEPLRRDFAILRNEFATYKKNVECELERLSVECLRLQMLNERNGSRE